MTQQKLVVILLAMQAGSNTDATISAITSTTYAIYISSNGHIFGVGTVAACTPAKSTKYY